MGVCEAFATETDKGRAFSIKPVETATANKIRRERRAHVVNMHVTLFLA